MQVGRHATLRTKKKSEKEEAVRSTPNPARSLSFSALAAVFLSAPVHVQDEQARMETYPNLLEPYRMKAMMGVKINFVAAGSAAAHIMCIDMEGRLFTWGRNSVRSTSQSAWDLADERPVSGVLAACCA